jgi:hypothetical protein
LPHASLAITRFSQLDLIISYLIIHNLPMSTIRLCVTGGFVDVPSVALRIACPHSCWCAEFDRTSQRKPTQSSGTRTNDPLTTGDPWGWMDVKTEGAFTQSKYREIRELFDPPHIILHAQQCGYLPSLSMFGVTRLKLDVPIHAGLAVSIDPGTSWAGCPH